MPDGAAADRVGAGGDERAQLNVFLFLVMSGIVWLVHRAVADWLLQAALHTPLRRLPPLRA